MKKSPIIALILIFICSQFSLAEQPRLAVVSADVHYSPLAKQNIPELIRIQLVPFNRYKIVDRYEIADVLQANRIKPDSCFSESCLIYTGQKLKVDKVLTASIDQMGDVLYCRLRLIDVGKSELEKEVVREFICLPEKIGTMITILLNDLFGELNDEVLVRSLSNKNTYENAVNNPDYGVLSLTGPRMGYSFLTRKTAQIIKADKTSGGFDRIPAFFQFGYQFEQEYLNEGKFQALFEFIPQVLGLDQQLFIPSFSILNGLRNNSNGFEFAIGPTINAVKESRFYKFKTGGDGEWHYLSSGTVTTENMDFDYRLDSRGDIRLKSYVVIAAGMSLRSGKLNIPINLFVVPSKDPRFGFSFGFNARGGGGQKMN
ncbi:MAG: hypothetical protein GC181_11605 [Bacteroidetes bacterium]|nr:hypothetical protein [Bacteroidota bacterium]